MAVPTGVGEMVRFAIARPLRKAKMAGRGVEIFVNLLFQLHFGCMTRDAPHEPLNGDARRADVGVRLHVWRVCGHIPDVFLGLHDALFGELLRL